MRKRFPKPVLIEGVNGTTHAGSLAGVACTGKRIADYRLTGKLGKRLKGNHSDVKCGPGAGSPADAGGGPAAVGRSRHAE